jgi:hypothetical protein
VRPYAVRREVIVPARAAAVTEALGHFVTEGKRLIVRATCHVPALRAEIALERDIVVALSEGPEGWEVRWSPTDDGPFPRFSGVLALSDEGMTTTLRLEGTCEFPAATAAAIGDVEVGMRLIQAVAATVLRKFAERSSGDWISAGARCVS